MGFKVKMATVSSEDLTQIRNDRPTGGYDGPTPPPGVYDAKISRVWFGETKAGGDTVKVSFRFDNEGEDAVYNGFDFIQNYNIPTDPSARAFVPQVNQLDAFLIALSGGKMGFQEFQEAMAEGRNDADSDKKSKIGIPVTQIGSVKITGDKKVRIKTDHSEYNGKTYVNLHYILREESSASAQKSEDNLDDFEDSDSSVTTSSSDSGSDDLDEWLDS